LLDYSAYVVRGFVGTNDLNFIDTRQWIANKHTPSVGGRVVATVGPVSLGGSVNWGYYDPNQKLTYLIYGVDAYARLGPVTFRGEFIARQTDFDLTATGYLYKIQQPYFVKAGYYAQLDWNAREWLTIIARADGILRRGMPLPDTPLTDQASIVRATAAAALRFAGYFMAKVEYAYWVFQGVPFENQHVVRAELVFSY
jgi:hypothetical protein